jgi:hypothetical protein
VIYIIVHVTFDYDRFQENLGATTDLREAQRLAQQASLKHNYGDGPAPILDYPAGDADHIEDSNGPASRPHIWIERFEQAT